MHVGLPIVVISQQVRFVLGPSLWPPPSLKLKLHQACCILWTL